MTTLNTHLHSSVLADTTNGSIRAAHRNPTIDEAGTNGRVDDLAKIIGDLAKIDPSTVHPSTDGRNIYTIDISTVVGALVQSYDSGSSPHSAHGAASDRSTNPDSNSTTLLAKALEELGIQIQITSNDFGSPEVTVTVKNLAEAKTAPHSAPLSIDALAYSNADVEITIKNVANLHSNPHMT